MPAPRASRGVAVVVLALILAPAGAIAQTPLTLGRTIEGRVGDVHTVEVTEAGLLTVVAHAENDIILQVADEEGQALPEGRIDVDWEGDVGLELGTVALPAAGTYLVKVDEFGSGGSSRYTLAASFLPFQALAQPPDPDGRPSGAARLAVGESRDGSIRSAVGDRTDWYIVRAERAGTFTVLLRAPGEDVGDLVLEAFLDSNYSTPVQRSDQDLQGNRANESVTVSVGAGQDLHIRVSRLSSSRDPIPYRISVGFLE